MKIGVRKISKIATVHSEIPFRVFLTTPAPLNRTPRTNLTSHCDTKLPYSQKPRNFHRALPTIGDNDRKNISGNSATVAIHSTKTFDSKRVINPTPCQCAFVVKFTTSTIKSKKSRKSTENVKTKTQHSKTTR